MGYVGRTPAYGYFERQVESGDGSTTQFNLDYPVASPNQLLVSVDGIIQEPDYSYSTTVSSGQGKINFSEAPDSSSRIFIIYTGRQLLTATPNTASSYIDEFNGDGSTTAFTLTRTPSSTDGSNFIVYIDNVYQREGSSYAFTVSGSTITFTSAPASGTNNIQVYQLATANAVATVTDGAVTTAKLANGAVTSAKLASTLDLSGKTVTYGLTDSDMPTGSILQVKNHTIDPGSQSTTSGTLVETGLTIDITPTSTSSKMLILASMHECYIGNSQKAIGLVIAKDGSRLNDADEATLGYTNSGGGNYFNVNLQAYDNPNTTNEITYSVMVRSIYPPETVSWCGDNTPAFLTVMEIAG